MKILHNRRHQNSADTLPILVPTNMDSEEKYPRLSNQFLGAYTESELTDYFTCLQNNLGTNNYSLRLGTLKHAISLHYNATTQRWLLIDPNKLPGKEYIHCDLLAKQVFSDLSVAGSTLVMTTNVYVTNNLLQDTLDNVSTMQQTPEWQKLPKISKTILDDAEKDRLWKLAIHTKNKIVIEEMLASHVNVNQSSINEGCTGIVLASTLGYSDIVALLIEHGANIELKSEEEGTALIGACESQHWDTAKLLISHGAQLNQKNKRGYTAFDYARLRKAPADLLGQLVSNLSDFQAALTDQTAQNCADILKAVNTRLPKLISNSNQLVQVILKVHPEQRLLLLTLVKDQLTQLIPDGDSLFKVLSWLSPEEKMFLLNALQDQMPQLLQTIKGVDTSLISHCPPEFTDVMDKLMVRIAESVKAGDNFINELLHCPLEHCSKFLDKLQERLPELLPDAARLLETLSYFNPEKQTILLNKVPHLIQSAEDATNLLLSIKYTEARKNFYNILKISFFEHKDTSSDSYQDLQAHIEKLLERPDSLLDRAKKYTAKDNNSKLSAAIFLQTLAANGAHTDPDDLTKYSATLKNHSLANLAKNIPLINDKSIKTTQQMKMELKKEQPKDDTLNAPQNRSA